MSAQTASAIVLSKRRPANPFLSRKARGQKGHLKTESHFINAGQLLHIRNLSKWLPTWTMAICQQTHHPWEASGWE